jgi:AraC-like DNA-binding protein
MTASYSRLIARVLGLHERDLPKLLFATQLTSKQFLQEDLLINAEQQIQILHNALTLSKDPAFGLQLGKQLTPPAHGAMGFLANSSPDFLTALQAFQTYSPTRTNFTQVKVEIHDEPSTGANEKWLACYHHVDRDLSPDVERCMSEAAAMSFFECAKFIIGRDIDEAITYFAHSKPEYSERYQAYIPGEFHFNSPHTYVKIPLSVCLIPNVSANHENYQLAMRQCESMLSQLQASKGSCKYQVQKIMLSSPPSQLSEENIAAELFISKRTLARRLIKEGTSYRQLRDEILSQQASQYLKDDQLSVEAIAALLNYHDSSNFRRAFKRWFSMSPDQFRQVNRASNRGTSLAIKS